MTDVSEVSLSDLITEGCQTRSKTRPEAVAEYAAVLGGGGSLDPCTAYRDQDGKFWLAAGHHRKAAYALAGRENMPCIVREGGQWEAIEFGIKDNEKQTGERLTAADRRHNVELVLREKPEMSDRMVAELCGVSHPTVAKRREQTSTGKTFQLPVRVGKDGKRRTARGGTSSSKRTVRKVRGAEPAVKSKDESATDGDGGRSDPRAQITLKLDL